MNGFRLRSLRTLALLFMVPGILGMMLSASLSTYYLETMPRSPAPADMRMTARVINGVTVFQTSTEDKRLSVCEFTSLALFVIGLALGAVYLEKWSGKQETKARKQGITVGP